MILLYIKNKYIGPFKDKLIKIVQINVCKYFAISRFLKEGQTGADLFIF